MSERTGRLSLEFGPFRLRHCFPPAEPLPRRPLAHRGGKGVAVSLGTPTDRDSQIRMPTCSGRLLYFSLLNSEVTQEQGVGPGFTFRTTFLPRGRPRKGGSKQHRETGCFLVLLAPRRTDRLGVLATHWAAFLQAQAGASLLAAQGHCFPQPHSEASCHLHRPRS